MGVVSQCYAPAALPMGIHFTEGWLGFKASLDGCEILHPQWDSIPGPSNPYRVAIQKICIFSKDSKPALGPTQSPIK